MKIVDKKIDEVLGEQKVNSKFITITNESQNIECNILTQNFYLDSFNYFPIRKLVLAWRDTLVP